MPGARRDPAPEHRDRRNEIEPVLAACVRIGADNPSTVPLLVAALRASSTPGARLVRRLRPPAVVAAEIAAARPPLLRWPCVMTAPELAALIGFPLGESPHSSLTRVRARMLPPSPRLPSAGRVLGIATGTSRPVAMRAGRRSSPPLRRRSDRCGQVDADAPVHRRATSRPGMASSSWTPRVTSPRTSCPRVPPGRRDDVVVLDPADTSCPVGLNVLAADEHAIDLVVDQVAGALRRLFHASYWGPRLDDILRAVARDPCSRGGMTLCEIPPLLTNHRSAAGSSPASTTRSLSNPSGPSSSS